MKKWWLFLFPIFAYGFVVDPYFTPIAEFEFRPSYTYRYYPSVDRSFNPSHYRSNDQIIALNLGVNFWPNWDFQVQSDFSHTDRLSWGGQRVGIQLRHLLLDDVAGDPISLCLGGQVYFVPTRNMRDVSSPYHSQGNLELSLCAGKEIDSTYRWLYRFWGFLGAGIANRGAPWLRPLLAVEGKFQQHHKLKLFSEGYFGFGGRHRVNIDNFSGYAHITHRSVDLGLNYTYLFRIWGSLGLQYAYRLYAHAFPERASTLTVEYRFPFSLF